MDEVASEDGALPLSDSAWDMIDRLRHLDAEEVERRFGSMIPTALDILTSAGFARPAIFSTDIDANGPGVYARISGEAASWFEAVAGRVYQRWLDGSGPHADAVASAVDVLSAAAAYFVIEEDAAVAAQRDGRPDPTTMSRLLWAAHDLGFKNALLCASEAGVFFDAGERRDLLELQRSRGRDGGEKGQKAIQQRKDERKATMIEAFKSAPPLGKHYKRWVEKTSEKLLGKAISDKTMDRYLQEEGMDRPRKKSDK